MVTIDAQGNPVEKGSVWFDERVIRISVCAWTTTSEIISQTVASFQKAYQLSINS